MNLFSLKTEYILNMSIISICWLTFYSLIGHYNAIYRKSRLKEISQIFMATIVGVTIIFFVTLLDDLLLTTNNITPHSSIIFFHFTFTSFLDFY